MTTDTPALDQRVWPYPKVAPVRNIGRDVPAGRVIAFEGPDGAGKSTQIDLLASRLRRAGRDVLVCSYLRNPLVGEAAAHGKWLNWDPYTAALTFASALTDLVNREVIPHANRPDGVVVLDRYIYSLIARAEVRGCPRPWLLSVLEPARVPHVTVHLRAPVADCVARKQRSARGFTYWESGADAFGPDHLRDGGPAPEFAATFHRYQQAVRDTVDQLLTGAEALVDDGSGTPDQVADRVLRFIRTVTR